MGGSREVWQITTLFRIFLLVKPSLRLRLSRTHCESLDLKILPLFVLAWVHWSVEGERNNLNIKSRKMEQPAVIDVCFCFFCLWQLRGLCWCYSGWWRYQLNTSWWCQYHADRAIRSHTWISMLTRKCRAFLEVLVVTQDGREVDKASETGSICFSCRNNSSVGLNCPGPGLV